MSDNPPRMTRERRRARRAPYQESVRWSIGKLRGECQVLDVAVAGLRIRCSRPIRLYSRIRLWLPLPDLEPGQPRVVHELEGVVVWVQAEQVGVSLIDPPAAARAALRALLAGG